MSYDILIELLEIYALLVTERSGQEASSTTEAGFCS